MGRLCGKAVTLSFTEKDLKKDFKVAVTHAWGRKGFGVLVSDGIFFDVSTRTHKAYSAVMPKDMQKWANGRTPVQPFEVTVTLFNL